MNYFVTGIDTDVGKTVICAVLAEALQADYWKPVQCGNPRDTETVKALLSNTTSRCHPEGVFLKEAASPHQAAYNEGLVLQLENTMLPSTNLDLIIEGAGGLMVPINLEQYMIDLAEEYANETVLVVKMYLGCINHSILTIDALQSRGIKLKGIIFNGDKNEHSESVILKRSRSKNLLHIPADSVIDKQNIKKWAQELKKNW